jgi:hypothetical protein
MKKKNIFDEKKQNEIRKFKKYLQIKAKGTPKGRVLPK